MAETQKARRDEPPLKRKRLEEDPQTEILHKVRIPKKRKADDESQVPSRESRDQSTTYEDGELPESPVVRKKPRLDDNLQKTPRDGPRERERPRERDGDFERDLKILPPKPAQTSGISPSLRKPQRGSTPSTQQSRDSSERPTAAKVTPKPHNGKFKRGSSIYTSSDDETPLKQSQASQSKSSANVPSQQKKKRDPPSRPPLPSDPAEIRSMYRERYVPYITTYGKVVAQKAKLEEALSGSVSSDMDLMDEDEVTKLAHELKMYQRELESIEAAYRKAGGREKLEPERMGRSSSSD